MKENPTLRLLHQRASLRVYDKRDISQETLDQILQAMMRAPTAGNQMLYSVIVVRDDATKQKLAQSCDHQAFIATAPVLLIFLADHQRWFDYYQQNDVAGYCDRQGLRFEAPQESDLLLAIEDAMIAAQNAVIAAESLGIGSCYIGDIMEDYEFHRELFDLPDWAFPIGMLCLGYYRENHLKKLRPRFEQQYIVLMKSTAISLRMNMSRCSQSRQRAFLCRILIMRTTMRRRFMPEKPELPSARRWRALPEWL